MKDNFYKGLIEKSHMGYAYHKIICDETGIPWDYEFIEVNNSFETLTGLKRSEIIGKRVTTVIPDIVNQKFDWIKCYGEVALGGEEKEFEQYVEALKKWFKVNVHSPEKGYFVTHFTDVSKEKIKQNLLKRLGDFSEGFLQSFEKALDYQMIADNFLELSQAKFAIINLYEEDGKNFTTMSTAGDQDNINEIKKLVGMKFEGQKWTYDAIRENKIKNEIVTVFSHLSELTAEIIDKSLSNQLEKMYELGEVALIKICKNNVMLGDITCFMPKQKSFTNDNVVKLYARQFGLAIIQQRANEKVRSSEELLKTTLMSIGEGVISSDNQGNVLMLNKVAEELTGWTQKDAYGKPLDKVFHIINEFTREKCENPVNRVLLTGQNTLLTNHTILVSKDNVERPIEDSAAPIKERNGNIFGVVSVFRDFTEKKHKQEEIEYLSFHDQLTGMYNRRFYEEELRRVDTARNLPLTIVMGDVNGLKLINDSFGHAMGDDLLIKASEVIKKGFRSDDIICRVGGDEFVIILPKTDEFETEQMIKRIKSLSSNESVGIIELSISFGFETKNNETENILDIFKKAEDHMYNNKLFESPSMRGKTVATIIKTLYGKNKKEEQHSQRVSKLCESMGEVLGLSEYKINELRTVGLLHDIGKIAIDENLLNSPGKVTADEWNEIKRHSEIGYRILSTVNEMSEKAEYVLGHHERWDGEGYPKGLKGEEIPIESRILAIADAYDAMTSERSYRSTMPSKSVVAELQKNAGIQFDPELVKIFIDKVLEGPDYTKLV